MRSFYLALFIWCLILANVSLQATTLMPVQDQTVQAALSRQEKPTLIKVDMSQIRQLSIFETINSSVHRLPFVENSAESRGWHIRIRPQPGNHNKLLVEREGGEIIGSVMANDPGLVANLSSFLEREARWRIIRSLENSSANSTIRIETRAVQIEVAATERIVDLTKQRKSRVAEGQLSEGDNIVFEIRNIGTTDAYITIVDLMSDGSLFQIYPARFDPIDNRIPPDGKWHRIPNAYFVITPPYGLEVFKIIATKQPIDLQVFTAPDTQARKTISPAFRNLFGKLLQGRTVSEAKPFKTSDWGTAALSFHIGPRGGPKIVTQIETDAPKTTLHILAVGINKYVSPALPRLSFAVKDAQDFAATLERVGKDRFAKVNTRLILDSDATKGNISAAFEKLIDEAKPEDTFVFFYAGVGHLTEQWAFLPSQFFLITADFWSKELSPVEVATGGISAAHLQLWFTKLEPRHQLIVLDACHSQAAFDAFVSRISKGNEALEGLLPRDIVILGTADVSYESVEKQNGFLTHTLLKALSTSVDNNSEITARKLLSSARSISATEASPLSKLKISGYVTGADFPLGTVVENSPGNKPAVRRHHHNVGPLHTLQEQRQPSPKRAEPAFPFDQSSKLVARKGKDFALLIAVNDYDHWKDLSNPITDARAVADELKKYYGFETEVLENPTKKEILAALLRYKRAKSYADDDQLFIFFAGHGDFKEDLKEGYLVARDSAADDLFGDSYIPYSLLRNVINYIPCKHILLVLDACFSGTFDERIARRGGDPEYEDATNIEFIRRKMELQTRRFITSGDRVYVPDGRPGQHSPFSRRLLDALRGYGGKYGVLTITGILAHVERVVPEPRQGEWGGNQPGSDFVFVARKPQTNTP